MIKSYVEEIFEEDLTSGEQVYIFFRSKGCGPCKQIEPQILEFAENFDKLVYIVESNEAKELQQKWGVRFYPSVAVAQDNKFQYLAEGTNKIMGLL